MNRPIIAPAEAKRKLDSGSAILVDIREPKEHAREAIPGARLQSLSTLDSFSLCGQNAPAVIFYCQSGRRTFQNAERLLGCGASETYLLEGGILGWKAAGYSTSVSHPEPFHIQRQVQITAGALIVLGLLLSRLVSPIFIGLSALMGACLIFAGVLGWCGMARLLGLMPWNRLPA